MEKKWACGHVVKPGTPAWDFPEKILARKVCPKCRAEEARLIEGWEDGTPKQIAWAQDIKKKMLARMENYRIGVPDHLREDLETAIKKVRETYDPEWFIDNRLRTARQLARILGTPRRWLNGDLIE